MTYMIQGMRDFASLHCIFQENNDSIGVDELDDIIEISNDHEGNVGDAEGEYV